MNAELLLEHFHRISDAPDAVPRLRRFILDLAVRGKLVPQDPNDEPASVLLKKITADKARLVKAGEIRKEEQHSPIPEGSFSRELPIGWANIRLGSIIHLVSGQHLQPPEYSNDPKSGPPYITGPADFGDDGLQITRYALVRKAVAKRGQLLLTVKGSGVGKTTTCNLDEVAISRQLMAITAIGWDARFLVLTTHALADLLQNNARSLIPGISREDVEGFVIGLPPLAEQHRIVAKVDELMALCDSLEAARTERETKRDRLMAASLARLNAPDPDPDTFADHARFALENLSTITARRDQVKQLRQTILNLAVRGKLVPQDPNDEPASALLTRVALEIKSYGSLHRVLPAKIVPVNPVSEPFSLPAAWSWARLCRLFKVITDGDHQPPPKSDTGIAFLTIGNVTTGVLDFAGCRQVPPEYYNSLARYRTPEHGDILYTVVGATYGRPIIVDNDRPFCVQRHIAILKPCENLSIRYLHHLLSSPFVYNQATSSTTGTAQPTIGLGPLRNFLVPVPPLAEQHRIVAKVDELMGLCDRLETSIGNGDDTRSRLLSALLHDALSEPEADE